MTTKLSSKGQIVLPAKVRRQLALSAGDSFDIRVPTSGVEAGNLVLAPRKKRRPKMKIVTDPITGWPMLKGPPGTPKLTSAMVKKLLADFP